MRAKAAEVHFLPMHELQNLRFPGWWARSKSREDVDRALARTVLISRPSGLSHINLPVVYCQEVIDVVGLVRILEEAFTAENDYLRGFPKLCGHSRPRELEHSRISAATTEWMLRSSQTPSSA